MFTQNVKHVRVMSTDWLLSTSLDHLTSLISATNKKQIGKDSKEISGNLKYHTART